MNNSKCSAKHENGVCDALLETAANDCLALFIHVHLSYVYLIKIKNG